MMGWLSQSLGPGRKVALVIGNSGYAGTDRLQSPAHDIKQTEHALKALGFSVTCQPDLDVKNLRACIGLVVDDLKRAPADVGLFYYSGHGMQIAGRNFLVPIGFEKLKNPDEDELVDLQNVINDFARFSTTTLVFLDACRSSATISAQGQAITLKAMSRPDVVKRISVAGKAVGLADMAKFSNTYIAFAAAPGQAAREGAPGRMSPFTEALVAHIGAVDLPIDTMMNRVHDDVSKATLEAQSTWGNSSLSRPYFFNPGSLLMLTGNLMALASLGGTTAIYTLVLLGGFAYSTGPIAFTLALISLTTLLLGAQRAYGRLRGVREGAVFNLPTHFLNCLRRGVFGGYIGAIGAAVFIGLPYRRAWFASCQQLRCTSLPGQWEDPMELGALLVEFAIACALVAVVLGFCVLFAAKLGFAQGRWRYDPTPAPAKLLLRGALGGAIAGILAAPPLTLYFGRFARPILDPGLLTPGGVVGAAILAFAIVNYDFEQLTVRRVRAGILAAFGGVLGGALLGGIVFGLLNALGVVQSVTETIKYDFYTSKLRMIPWTWIYGFTAGVVLGFVIALAEVLTDRWSRGRERNSGNETAGQRITVSPP